MTKESARDWRVRWRVFFSEVLGTGAPFFGGLSLGIVLFGAGNPVWPIVPNDLRRTAPSAFLFCCVGTAVKLQSDSDRYPKSWLFHHRWGRNAAAVTARGERIRHDTIGGRTTAWVPTVQH